MSTNTRSFEDIKQHLAQSILSIQKPSDYIIHVIYSQTLLAPVRFCTESGIFHQLSASKSPLSATELADTLRNNDKLKESDVAHQQAAGDRSEGTRDLIVRMLRAVCALGLIDEIADFTYAANALTYTMADPGFTAGCDLIFDNVMGPKSTMSEMTRYFKANEWSAPASAIDGPWQRARGVVGKTTFETWVAEDPVQLTRLSMLMQRMQGERMHWTKWFPEDVLFAGHRWEEKFVFVDVGGGRGHDLLALAKKYPGSEMSFVLQDLSSVVKEAEAERKRNGEKLDSRIKVVVQDFFQPQSVRGADVYYMHKIMHDWPDSDCVRILTRLKDAMASHSRIFINEIIVPNRGCSLFEAAVDIDMLALHSGQERDEEMWRRLISKVEDLCIRRFWKPVGGEGEGIVEVGLDAGSRSK